MQPLKLSDYDFELPPHLIAQRPLAERTTSRLLDMSEGASNIIHRKFEQLPQLLNSNDLLVLNNTKVIPARLYGQKSTGGKVEVMLERIMHDNQALVMMKASKTLAIDSQVHIDEDVRLRVCEREGQYYVVTFETSLSVLEVLKQYGHMPLPPYIKRDDDDVDRARYQTVYAERDGAVAAPTAGLHFTQALLETLQEQGVELGYVTLHVGAGTFSPVRSETITDHKMHAEYIEVSSQLCEQIQATRARGGRVIAVGTTVVRSLESAHRDAVLKPFYGDTDIFIYPGFQFNCVDALITNFHLPKSSLLMLVSAFSGHQAIKEAYRIAIAEQYRFFSYGDAMFLARS